MTRPGPQLPSIDLTALERTELQRTVADSKATDRQRQRAMVVLLASEGASNAEIATKLEASTVTVRAWRNRFAERRLDGLHEAPRTGAPKEELVLTETERDELERWVRRGTISHRLAQRARIVLRCADGLTNQAVGHELDTSAHTVSKWRRRFLEDRVDGLQDDDRPGTPRQIGDDQIEAIVVRTLETMPEGASRWSTRLMSEKAGVSRQAISRIWRAFELKPHRVSETFQLSKDPLFVEKVRDVVGLYMSPPDHAVVLSVDEKSQIQALNRTQPLLPLRPGQLAAGTPEYQRNGTTSLFAALDVATSQVIGKCHRRHRAKEFVSFLRLIDQSVCSDLEVHLILDNYATHKTPAVKQFLVAHPRFHLHFTPTHASWLNLVESFFAKLTTQQLKPASHHSVRELEQAIYEYLKAHNDNPKPFRWTKTADEILAKVARHCDGVLKAHT